MGLYGVEQTVYYVAWDTSANAPKTGDVSNHTLRWVKDGTASAPTNSPAEVDATNAPGWYKLTVTATEAQCLKGLVAGKSSTGGVVIFGMIEALVRLPNAAPGGSGGLPTVDASNRVAGVQGTINTLDGLPTASGIATAVWEAGTRVLTAATNLGIPSTGDIATAVWGAVTRTLTAATNLGIPSAADVATAVWAAGARTLTSFGTLAADVWGAATRTLTGGVNVIQVGGTVVAGPNDLKADVSGLSTLNAAGVRTAVGLATANLDTQLGTLSTLDSNDVDSVVAANVANLATATNVSDAQSAIIAALPGEAPDAGTVAAAVGALVATTGGKTVLQALNDLHAKARGKFVWDSETNTLTVYRDDGVTVAWQCTISATTRTPL